MSGSGPNTLDLRRLSEQLIHRDEHMYRKYGEQIAQYRQADQLGRLAIAQQYPQVAEYVAYLDAQQSIVDARRSAPANEGNIVII